MKPIAAVVGLLLLPFCWGKPRYGMLLLVMIQVIFLGGSLELDAEKLVYGAFFCLLMLAWLPGFFRTRQAWISHPIAKWLLAVFGVILISRFAGAAHGIPTIDWFRDLSPMLNYSWILLGVYAFGPGLDMRKYGKFLLACIAIVTIPITLQWMYFRALFDSPGTIVDNATLGPGVTVFGVFLAAAFALEAKDKHTKRKFLLIAGAFVAAAFATGTRTVLASIAAGCFAYFLLFRREGKVSFRGVISVVAIPLLLVPLVLYTLSATKLIDTGPLTGRYGEVLTSEMLEDDTIQDRVMETLDAWNAFRQSPLLGQGLGYRTETVYHIGGVEFEPGAFFVHDFYAYLLAKLGITGFVVFVGFLICIIYRAIRGYFQRPDGFEKYYFGSMVALMSALMLMSLAGSQFNDRLSTAFLGIMVGMMIAMDRRANEPVPTGLVLAHVS
jgi:O-antigen ligase